jgi:phage tail-like protein
MTTPTAGGSDIRVPGNGASSEPIPGDPVRPLSATVERSSYLQYLPGIYHDNDFLGRFLLIFESILGPMDRMVGNLHHYLDPDVAPPETLRWLASWLGIVLDERWPEDRQRDLVRGATDLYRWRGTRRGLSTVIRLATGITPEITEPTVAELTADPSRAFRFGVRLVVPRGQEVDRQLIQSIIDLEKPAWAACDLEISPGRAVS